MNTNIHHYIKRPRAAVAGPWAVLALCAAYNWPPKTLTGGAKVGIVEMGGGWVQSDLDLFSKANGLPTIVVTDVSIDGTKNTPTAGSDSPDVEVALDIEVVAGSHFAATGKLPPITVYWTGDMAAAVNQARLDGCRVISISWGASETNWSAVDMQAMQAAVAAAVAAGCTVFAACGDNDADDDDGDGQPSVDCPASCPAAIGCGGTTKVNGGSETVWDNSPAGDPSGEGTGGGYSAEFPVQPFQLNAPKPPTGLGRMVPDVTACGDPNTGYEIYVHGSSMVVGGTSAVAPLYAGLLAAIDPPTTVNVQDVLWKNQGAFTDITQGTNGFYAASAGPDPCSGVGAPDGAKIAGLFASAPAPQPTPTPAPPAPTPAPSGPPTLAEIEAAITKALTPGFPYVPRKVAIANAIAAVVALPGWSTS